MPKNFKNSLQFQEPETPNMRKQNYHITVKVKYLYRCLRSHCWVHTTITDIYYLLNSFKCKGISQITDLEREVYDNN